MTVSAAAPAQEQPNDSISVSFVALMALLLSVSAFSIDTLIPAMAAIADSYALTNANDAQLLISSVLLGLAFGQLLFGAISDSFGRKKAIYIGVGLYTVACLAAMVAPSFELLILSRFIQGFGASATRIGPIAIVRDQYKGEAMARIMSFVVSFFILVPAVAPLLGQAILQYGPWPSIFAAMVALSVVILVWFGATQRETLTDANRSPFSFSSFRHAAWETLAHPITRGYTIAAGFVFGALIAYLNTSQQLLAFQYQLGDDFAYVFGGMALCLGLVSFANAMLVKRFGLKPIVLTASVIFAIAACLLGGVSWAFDGHPPFFVLTALLSLSFMTFGALFGNFNAMAISPLGHIAGVASSVTSFVQSVISVSLGGLVAYLYDGTTMSLGLGFAAFALLNLGQVLRLDRRTQ